MLISLILVALALSSIAASPINQSVATNPFANVPYYVNPSFVAEIQASIDTCTDATACANLKLMQKSSSAFWIDVKSKINGTDTKSVEGILADAASKHPPQLVVFIVYDLPNRDCHAKASNGEICCNPNADGTCNYD